MPSTKVNKELTTHLILVVDRSGSMASIQEEMQAAINSQLLEASKAGNTKVTLVEFDEHIDICEREVEPDSFTYKLEPRGWTAMLDAVGLALLTASGRGSTDYDSYLMIIISDGQENRSVVETWESIGRKIKFLTTTGKWTFSYVGANQDLSVVSERMSIPFANTMSYSASRIGTQNMNTNLTNSSAVFYGNRADGVTASSGFVAPRKKGKLNV